MKITAIWWSVTLARGCSCAGCCCRCWCWCCCNRNCCRCSLHTLTHPPSSHAHQFSRTHSPLPAARPATESFHRRGISRSFDRLLNIPCGGIPVTFSGDHRSSRGRIQDQLVQARKRRRGGARLVSRLVGHDMTLHFHQRPAFTLHTLHTCTSSLHLHIHCIASVFANLATVTASPAPNRL